VLTQKETFAVPASSAVPVPLKVAAVEVKEDAAFVTIIGRLRLLLLVDHVVNLKISP
jgi:hypothetical protein